MRVLLSHYLDSCLEYDILDRRLGSEIKEPSHVSNEIDVISQRLAERSNTKMTQIEEQLNSKFEEILKERRENRSSYIISDEEDAKNNRPGPSNSENRILRKNTHQAHQSTRAIIRMIASSPRKGVS